MSEVAAESTLLDGDVTADSQSKTVSEILAESTLLHGDMIDGTQSEAMSEVAAEPTLLDSDVTAGSQSEAMSEILSDSTLLYGHLMAGTQSEAMSEVATPGTLQHTDVSVGSMLCEMCGVVSSGTHVCSSLDSDIVLDSDSDLESVVSPLIPVAELSSRRTQAGCPISSHSSSYDVHTQVSRQQDTDIPLVKSSSQQTQAGSQTSAHNDIDDSDADGNGNFSEPCDSEMEPSHLVVRPTSNKLGKRVYNRRHYCIYCKMAFFHLPRHLYAQHAEEQDEAEILAADGDRQKALLTRLRNLGAEQHNIQVHKDGSGEIAVVYRPSWCMDELGTE